MKALALFGRAVKHFFWSPVRDGENSAQTLFRVAGNFVRIGCTLFAVWLVKSVFVDAPYRWALAQTQVAISYDRAACPQEGAPLRATVQNLTAEPPSVVSGIWLKIFVYEGEEQINRRKGTWRLFDAAIEPNETAQRCLEIPDFNPGRPLAADHLLEYRAEIVELRRDRFEPGQNYDFDYIHAEPE